MKWSYVMNRSGDVLSGARMLIPVDEGPELRSHQELSVHRRMGLGGWFWSFRLFQIHGRELASDNLDAACAEAERDLLAYINGQKELFDSITSHLKRERRKRGKKEAQGAEARKPQRRK